MKTLHGRSSQVGLTLLETALILLVAGLMTWSAFSVYGGVQDAQTRREAQHSARQLQGQLRAYALRQGRLPCPDTSAGATGYEDLLGGACAPGSQVGWFPYLSLGLVQPTEELRARYAVYRQASATPALDADLAVSKERNGDAAGQLTHQDVGDLIVALNTASLQSPVASLPFVTGDGGLSGPSGCATHVAQQVAYWLVLPLQDRSGDGQRLDAPNSLSGLCANAASAPVTASNDDLVLAESPTQLGGWLRQNLP